MRTNYKRVALIAAVAAATIAAGALAVYLCLLRPILGTGRVYSAADFGISELKSGVDKDGDGADDYTDIMLGAREYIEARPAYKSAYYSGGYPDDGFGVCTDVIWYAFKSAGYDLKALVDADIAGARDAYPAIAEPDPNIDFRRVRNLKIFFERNATALTTDLSKPAEWQAGDIVVFNEHVGICSDKRNADGLPFIIHFDGLGAREADNIRSYGMAAHFRWTYE